MQIMAVENCAENKNSPFPDGKNTTPATTKPPTRHGTGRTAPRQGPYVKAGRPTSTGHTAPAAPGRLPGHCPTPAEAPGNRFGPRRQPAASWPDNHLPPAFMPAWHTVWTSKRQAACRRATALATTGSGRMAKADTW